MTPALGQALRGKEEGLRVTATQMKADGLPLKTAQDTGLSEDEIANL